MGDTLLHCEPVNRYGSHTSIGFHECVQMFKCLVIFFTRVEEAELGVRPLSTPSE